MYALSHLRIVLASRIEIILIVAGIAIAVTSVASPAGICPRQTKNELSILRTLRLLSDAHECLVCCSLHVEAEVLGCGLAEGHSDVTLATPTRPEETTTADL